MSRGRRAGLVYPSSAFIDSSALYAHADSRDSNHRRAVETGRALSRAGTRLLLTNFIRAETHALILNRLGHHQADVFLQRLAESFVDTIVLVTPTDEMRALALIARYRDKDFTLTDATSFIVMERLGLTHAFTFDDDFRQYGWIVVPA